MKFISQWKVQDPRRGPQIAFQSSSEKCESFQNHNSSFLDCEPPIQNVQFLKTWIIRRKRSRKCSTEQSLVQGLKSILLSVQSTVRSGFEYLNIVNRYHCLDKILSLEILLAEISMKEWYGVIQYDFFCYSILLPYMSPVQFGDKFGDKFSDKFGDKFGDHQTR